MQCQVSDHARAVMSVLLAHPGRLHSPSELAAAAWGVHAGDWIVELAATIERLQEWLEHQPERLEEVETDDSPQYRLLVPQAGPGTESAH